jgi:rare lipoprotein A (peptidoglycan hydrolase)
LFYKVFTIASAIGILWFVVPVFKDIFDEEAQHKLPLGTRIMVTNLNNGKSIEVLVNDRGPFAKGRIIDLSHAAARSIDMVGAGTAPVRIGHISQVDNFVTDRPPPEAVAELCRHNGVSLEVIETDGLESVEAKP